MKLLAKILGIALALAVTCVACGAAATLALGSQKLSAGNTTVSSCGVSSLSATRDVDASGNVTQISVGSLPAACAGETLVVTLANSSNVSLGSASATIAAGGGTITLSGFGTISAASLSSYKFAVVGA